ncbi:MAG: hypothetical protein N2506_07170, partial [Dehalococcoidales bacterium]|nr:hypothetical protein [Dehalococcoidales bacterium]
MMTQGAPENQAEIQSEAATGQEALLRELELRGAAIIQLRQGLEAKEGEIAALARENGGLRQAVEGLKASLAEAVAAYRALVLKATPEWPAELVSGSSIA